VSWLSTPIAPASNAALLAANHARKLAIDRVHPRGPSVRERTGLLRGDRLIGARRSGDDVDLVVHRRDSADALGVEPCKLEARHGSPRAGQRHDAVVDRHHEPFGIDRRITFEHLADLVGERIVVDGDALDGEPIDDDAHHLSRARPDVSRALSPAGWARSP
jgi:hypothetical protein